ncbi:MAG: hypothetical protein KME08_08885 [Aphanothece sp. CMT-3BRIN-NPC111]|jgi:hypothetical protein|nr:hypothetical protein [Aphanothece sp. CMT-3BRIN-NPC111]
MSLNPEQLRQHCEVILTSRRIRNKLVVLCEGNIPDLQGRPSPQAYGKMESMPDANFYKACVPTWWKEFLPQFFNCGDRDDVLNTYFSLLDLHETDSSHSYLEPRKLFAIVDLDIQVKSLSDYLFSDTESIFNHLYKNAKVNEVNASQHRIWVTGLIHKEAYFLLPKLQEIFDHFPTQAVYNNSNILLEDLHLDIADETTSDIDLQKHFQRVCNRICYCTELDFTDIVTLKDTWISQFQNSHDITKKEELVFALLTIRKAKKYWNQIQPSNEWTRPVDAFKDQLILKIARFYSEETDSTKYHIPSFFKNLYQFVNLS